MTKTTKRILLSILIIILLYFSAKPIFIQWKNTDTLIARIGNLLYECNKINVKTDPSILIKDIIIKDGNKIVFSNGRQRGKINQDYGNRTLDIFYKKTLLESINCFCTNNWFVNDYYIHIQSDEGINVKYKIDGPCQNNVP
jgi:hypothetical protein